MPCFCRVFVWRLPSGAWHLAQLLSQFSFASVGDTEISPAAVNARISRMVFFISRLSYGSLMAGARRRTRRPAHTGLRTGRESPFWLLVLAVMLPDLSRGKHRICGGLLLL